MGLTVARRCARPACAAGRPCPSARARRAGGRRRRPRAAAARRARARAAYAARRSSTERATARAGSTSPSSSRISASSPSRPARNADQASASGRGAGGGVALGRLARQRVHEPGHGGDVGGRGLGVQLADLERAEPRVRSHVPPHVRVVVDSARRGRSPRPPPRSRRSRAAPRGRRGRGRRARSPPARWPCPSRARTRTGSWRPARRAAAAARAAPLYARIAVSGSGMPTWTCSAHSGVRWIRSRIAACTRR